MKICNRGRKESCLQRYFRIAASTKIEISVKFNPLRKNSLSHDLVSTMSVSRKKLNLRHQHRTKKNTIDSPTKIQTFFNYNSLPVGFYQMNLSELVNQQM